MFELISRRPRTVCSLAVLALLVRLGYVIGTSPRRLPLTDALFYQGQANLLAEGHGFIQPLLYAFERRSVPSAAHPPLYSLFLAAGSVLGAKSVFAHQVMGCVLGVFTVIGAGLIAYHVAGERAGLVAMGLAAIYPPLWVNDGGLMSEGLFTLLTAVIILWSYRLLERTRMIDAAVLGAAIGLAILTRAEAVLLFIVLVVPLIWAVRRVGARRSMELLTVTTAVAALVVGPWVGRNLVAFHHPVTLSTGDSTLLGANCPPAYYGPGIGTWYLSCYPPFGQDPRRDESDFASAARQAGLRYIGDHPLRVPLVVAVRVARVWQVYQPIQDADNNLDDGRPKWSNYLALSAYALLVPVAVAGGVVLVRRRQKVLPLVAQVAGVTLTAAVVWGAVRFRAPVELVLVVLAAVALSGASEALSRRSEGRRLSAPGRRLSAPGRRP